MNNYFAKKVSIILSPLFLLSPLTFYLMYANKNNFIYSLWWEALSLLFILSFFLLMIVGVRKKIFIDLNVSKKEQRPLLFVLMTIWISAYFVIIYLLNAPKILFISTFAILFTTTILIIFNKFTKVSAHTATISAIVTATVLIYGYKYLSLFALVTLVGWSRIKTKNHTLKQVILGGVIGVVSIIILYLVFR